MNTNIEELNTRINEIEKMISNIKTMDNSAADAIGTTNADLVAYQNDLVNLKQERDKLVKEEYQKLSNRLTEIIDERNRLDEEMEMIESRINVLNNLSSEPEKDKKENISKEDSIYNLDEKGQITYFKGTMIPKPRNRKTYETDEEYIDFLTEYYRELERKGLFNHRLKIETKEVPKIETKEVPMIETKKETKYEVGPHLKPIAVANKVKPKEATTAPTSETKKEESKINNEPKKEKDSEKVILTKKFKDELKNKATKFKINTKRPRILKVVLDNVKDIWHTVLSINWKEELPIIKDTYNTIKALRKRNELLNTYHKYESQYAKTGFPTNFTEFMKEEVKKIREKERKAEKEVDRMEKEPSTEPTPSMAK